MYRSLYRYLPTYCPNIRFKTVDSGENLKSYSRSKHVLKITFNASRKLKNCSESCYRKFGGLLKQIAAEVVAREDAEIATVIRAAKYLWILNLARV